MTPDDAKGIEARLQHLVSLDRTALIAAWTQCHGRPPPPKTSKQLMMKAIAYQWQAELLGCLGTRSRKALRKIAVGGGITSIVPTGAKRSIKPGTRFVRDWHGQPIEVMVSEDGSFLWNGESYTSLSAIARKITGTRRNGPAFFGLREV